MDIKCSALIGNPVNHSVSDIMFNALIHSSEFYYSYRHDKINVEPDKLEDTLAMLSRNKYVGLNVTLPYKRSIIKYVDQLDTTAAHIGAVNTIKINNNSLVGFNTDWFGLYKPLLIHSKKNEPVICIFGTGGASRAAIYAARKISNDVYVFYRESPNVSNSTQDLLQRQKDLRITLLPYRNVKDIVNRSDIIINTTSTGMKGNIETTPFNIEVLENINMKKKIFIEAVFNPVETTLGKFFTGSGAKTIDGLWMMIYQGILALSIWLERDIHIKNEDLKKIHKLLMEAIS
ncbi:MULTISPECIES: shikimate dehydrogenase [Bacillus]|uniref:shikimate dehydrogenase n=1 Tax=Bacillus TaxID=1386 RepID=UPI00077A7BB6|nr:MULTISPECIES: shikimate dehydrogenase [Bacillus cereus group]KXY72245.1 shikimate dehydrogenase [Bacillus cereus]MBG9938045.1 shikimate dehydrogenase [Bacillus tropicus]MED2996729.1 shikimate dehydrogenase [Bacillus tropicus]OTY53256.1 shikimate dehydrogenase [Bacillus thuringiensis serovar graciosensis]